MHNLINSFDEVTTDWIEACLSREINGLKGLIRKFEIAKRSMGPLLRRAIVKLEYKNKDKQLPGSLFVKIAKATGASGPRCKEVDFYNDILQELTDNMNYPHCYFAHCDKSRQVNLVLEDLSDTHFSPELRLPPMIKYCIMAVDSIGRKNYIIQKYNVYS